MASNQHHDDDLTPEQTQGFKVGEKKTLDEYHQLGPRRTAHYRHFAPR